MNPGVEKGYALDFVSVVTHVARKLEEGRLSGRSLPIHELMEGYQPFSADLHRVKLHHGFNTDREATRFLVERALATLGDRQVEEREDGWVLLRPFEDVRYQRKKLRLAVEDNHRLLHDAFNPMSGRFAENIRRATGKDNMDELRESMREFGWIKELPAIKDERGVVIIGHRRLKVADELGIDPNVTTIPFGDGDEADARRFKLAIASNIGAKPFTVEERREIAGYLYGERDWSCPRIAEALNVDSTTVVKDLRKLGIERKLTPINLQHQRGHMRIPEQESFEAEIAAKIAEGKSLEETATEMGIPISHQPSTVARSRFGATYRRIQEGRTGEYKKFRKRTPALDAQVIEMHDQGQGRARIREATGYSHGTQNEVLGPELARRELLQQRAVESAPPQEQDGYCTCPHCGHRHPRIR